MAEDCINYWAKCCKTDRRMKSTSTSVLLSSCDSLPSDCGKAPHESCPPYSHLTQGYQSTKPTHITLHRKLSANGLPSSPKYWCQIDNGPVRRTVRCNDAISNLQVRLQWVPLFQYVAACLLRSDAGELVEHMLRSIMLPHFHNLNPFLGVVVLVVRLKIHGTPFGDNF